MTLNTLHVGQLNFPEKHALKQSLKDIESMDSVAEFEKSLRQSLNVKHVFTVGNGTVAIMAALSSLGRSGEVIVPSFTFISTVQAVLFSGFTPVFCDVDADDHMINAELVSPLITDKTVAVIGVNLWGNMMQTSPLKALCVANGIKLVSDSAHAFGCRNELGSAAVQADVSCFSFHATKVLNSAEGGCVTTNCDEMANRLTEILQGDSGTYRKVRSPMSRAQAAIGILSLQQYEENGLHNKALFDIYRASFAANACLRLYEHRNATQTNYQYIVVELIGSLKTKRDQLLAHLKKHQILARDYFNPPIHQLDYVVEHLNGCCVDLPVTEALCQSLIQLPVGQSISEKDVERMCSLVNEFTKRSLTPE